jgi:hypothetical protein
MQSSQFFNSNPPIISGTPLREVVMFVDINHAPRDAHTLLRREIERNPHLPIYDICFRIEQFLDRKTYHAVLAWADTLTGPRASLA